MEYVGTEHVSQLITYCRRHASGPVLGPTHPPIHWMSELKRPGREADHSSVSHRVWICPGDHPLSYPMGVGVLNPGLNLTTQLLFSDEVKNA